MRHTAASALRWIRSSPSLSHHDLARIRFISSSSSPFPPSSASTPSSSSQSASSSSFSSSPSTAARDAVVSTLCGVGLLVLGGIAYHRSYKWLVLWKLERSFDRGYDPVLELLNASSRDGTGLIPREQRASIDQAIKGQLHGQYLLVLGPKGSGKTTMIIEAIYASMADGVSYFEAHPDAEIFRLRIGKALEFEYNEDSFGGLFSRKEPRETTPLLDIERALNKLEKVAIRSRRSTGRPLVLVVNHVHLVSDNYEGDCLLNMLQQRAESWARSNVLTMVFVSNDFRIYERLKRNAIRMNVLSVEDLNRAETLNFLAASRSASNLPPISKDQSSKVFDLIGGRIGLLDLLSREDDVDRAMEEMIQRESSWLTSRLGLIPDLDDDVMDEQKISSCSILLFQEFARLANEAESKSKLESDADEEGCNDIAMDYRRAREIMTRADYFTLLDNSNIISIDRDYLVRPDSRLLLSVFRSITSAPDFESKLDNVRNRIDFIEALHRTSELTVKNSGDLGGVLKIRMTK